ncbi:MAG: hypothetical protein KGI03_04125, partial [Patescibacteria group bacterium]|nr:hypothetical protein [Patescibacteria group bacterium]
RGDLTRFCEPCEGDWLKEKGDALVVPLGGCLLCVASAVDATGRPRIAAFHAGLPSLVDYRPLASDLGPSRRHESVLGSVRTSFWRGWQIPPERIRLECFFGLPAGTLKYHFGRPGGHLYRALLDHVQVRWGGVAAYEMEDEEGPAVVVDPGMIFVMQALDLGFGSTARSCDLPPDGPFAYTRHPREDLSGECRNLGAVIRTA